MLTVEDIGKLPIGVWEVNDPYGSISARFNPDILGEANNESVWQQGISLFDVLPDLLRAPRIQDSLNLRGIIVRPGRYLADTP